MKKTVIKKNVFVFFILFVFCLGKTFSAEKINSKKNINNESSILESIWCLALDSDDSSLISNAKQIVNDFCTDWKNSDQNFRSGLFALNDDTRETCLSFAFVIQYLNSLQEFSGTDYILQIENRLGVTYGELWTIQQQIISSCEVYNNQNQKVKNSFLLNKSDSTENSFLNKNMKKQNVFLRAEEINQITSPTEDIIFEIVSSPDLFYILNNSKRYRATFYKLFLSYFDSESEIDVENIVLPISANSVVSETVEKLKIAGKLRILILASQKLSRQYGIPIEPTVSPLCKQIGGMITFNKTVNDSELFINKENAGVFSKEESVLFSNAILQFSKKDFENALKQYTEVCSIISSIGEKSFLIAKKSSI